MKRSATLHYTGHIGAYEDSAMTLSMNNGSYSAGSWYNPAGTLSGMIDAPTINAGGEPFICGRNYITAGGYIECSIPASDDTVNITLYINGIATTLIANIPNGSTIGTVGTDILNLNRGDQLAWQPDSGASNNIGNFGIALQLEPY